MKTILTNYYYITDTSNIKTDDMAQVKSEPDSRVSLIAGLSGSIMGGGGGQRGAYTTPNCPGSVWPGLGAGAGERLAMLRLISRPHFSQVVWARQETMLCSHKSIQPCAMFIASCSVTS